MHLLNIAADGQVSCGEGDEGCVLPKSCVEYPALWEYSFKVKPVKYKFEVNSYYWKYPLASIAKDDQDICRIYVS